MTHRKGKDRILWIESIGFSIIIALAWLTEILGLPHLLFDEAFTPNWSRAILRTVAIVLVWIWVRAETKRLLIRLHRLEEYLLVCAWCRKIGDNGEWVTMEKYFGSNFDTRTSHAMCPECSEKFVRDLPAPKA
jgi:hypothetical protein